MEKDLLYLRNELLKAGLKKEAAHISKIIKISKDGIGETVMRGLTAPTRFLGEALTGIADKARGGSSSKQKTPQAEIDVTKLISELKQDLDRGMTVEILKPNIDDLLVNKKINEETYNKILRDLEYYASRQQSTPTTPQTPVTPAREPNFIKPQIARYTTQTTPGTVKPGDKSAEVKSVQDALIERNYLKLGGDDTAFGPTTAEAIYNAIGKNIGSDGANTADLIASIKAADVSDNPIGSTRTRRSRRKVKPQQNQQKQKGVTMGDSGLKTPGINALFGQ